MKHTLWLCLAGIVFIGAAIFFVLGRSASANTAQLSGQQKFETLLAAGYEAKAGEDGYGLIDIFLQKGSSMYLCEGSQDSRRIRACYELKSQ